MNAELRAAGRALISNGRRMDGLYKQSRCTDKEKNPS
jgi:hypothetical protein